MATETLQLTVLLPAAPERVYSAWLDSAEHGAFTGVTALLEGRVGGGYSAWDGYIRGVTLALEPGRRIVQSWRTDEFPSDAADSRLELAFAADPTGTLLTLTHSEIPEGLAHRYEEGWIANYFEPMRTYFRGEGPRSSEALTVAAPRPLPARKRRRAAKTGKRETATKRAAAATAKRKTATKRAPAGTAKRKTAAKRAAGKTAKRKQAAKRARKTPRRHRR